MTKHRLDLTELKAYAKEISLHDFAKSLLDTRAFAIRGGSFDLPTLCTWHTIYDRSGVFDSEEYRIHCDGGMIDVEVDGVVIYTNLMPGNSTDVIGKKIRVHAKANSSNGAYDRL